MNATRKKPYRNNYSIRIGRLANGIYYYFKGYSKLLIRVSNSDAGTAPTAWSMT